MGVFQDAADARPADAKRRDLTHIEPFYGVLWGEDELNFAMILHFHTNLLG